MPSRFWRNMTTSIYLAKSLFSDMQSQKINSHAPLLMKLVENMLHKIIEKTKKNNNIGPEKCELWHKKEGEESPKRIEKENARKKQQWEVKPREQVIQSRVGRLRPPRAIPQKKGEERGKRKPNIWYVWLIWSSVGWGI